MQRVLSSDLWKSIVAQARRARRKRAAIAYVSKDLIGFRKGDTLLVDAAVYAVRSGETSAAVLTKLHDKGVAVYDCPRLHAKLLLLGDVAVIGSGNMSNSSADGLVEAGIITDHGPTVAGVASFIEQLVTQSSELDARRLGALRKIKVIRRGGLHTGQRTRRKPKLVQLGNRTWLVGIRELPNEPRPDEQRLIDQAVKKLRPIMRNSEDEPDWIRWVGETRFVRECREGDSIIRIWRSSKAKRPSAVMRAAPVLLKQTGKSWTRFYLRGAAGSRAEMSWGKFKGLLKDVSGIGRVSPGTVRLLKSDAAEALAREWTRATKR